jgi:hypothetical protein
MLSAISKRYHPSIGKSVTSFMVGRREKACYLPALQNDAIWPVATNFSLGPDVSFQGEAEVGRAAEFAASVENDPKRKSRCWRRTFVVLKTYVAKLILR